MPVVYKPPGVIVRATPNPRLVNLAADIRVPVVVAEGPTTVTVVDEVIRRSGDANEVVSMTKGGITAASARSTPTGAPVGNAWTIEVDGDVGTTSEDAVINSTTGRIQWAAAADPAAPALGSYYYVTYTMNVDSTEQYMPQLLSTFKDIEAWYGVESSTTILTTMAKIVLENGALAVYALQKESGDSAATTVAKLENKPNISYIIYYDDTWTASEQQSVLTHAINMSAPEAKLERSVIIPCDTTTISDIDSYTTRASTFAHKRSIVIAPETCKRTIDSTEFSFTHNLYLSCAVAGIIAAQRNPITPVHGFNLAGISITDDLYTEFEMNRLGLGGVLVTKSTGGGVPNIRDAITTDVTSADTQEISVVEGENLVKRLLRIGLERKYLGKGVVIDNTLLSDVRATIVSILTSMVNNHFIAEYGTTSNPETGEQPINVVQNSIEPRQIDIVLSVKYLYPAKFFDVTFTTYV